MNPDSSINGIAERTVLPQSYVPETVAKLVDQGLVHTKVDTSDKRRTLVRINEEHLDHVARASSIADVKPFIRRSIRARDEGLWESSAGAIQPILTQVALVIDRTLARFHRLLNAHEQASIPSRVSP